MKSTREIIIAIESSKPKITIDAVQADGDVAFHVLLKDCSLEKEDCSNPVMRTRFLIDFVGEMLVRENINRFASILTGLDPALYQKMICTCRHTDFGMVVDHKLTTMIFQMHMSLVQEILTEQFGKVAGHSIDLLGNAYEDFDASGTENKPSDNDDEDNSEE